MRKKVFCRDSNIRLGDRVKLINEEGVEKIKPDSKGNFEVTGKFDDGIIYIDEFRMVWREEDITINEHAWQTELPTRDELTGSEFEEKDKIKESDQFQGEEISGIHTITAVLLEPLPKGTRIRLVLFNGQQIARRDPDGDYVIIVQNPSKKQAIVSLSKDADEAEQHQFDIRFEHGRRCGRRGDSCVDIISPKEQKALRDLKRKKK